MTYFITRIKVVFFTFSLLLQLHCLFLLQFHVWSDLPSILVNARLRAQGDLGIRESAGVFITVGLEHACWVILVTDLSACFVGGHLALPSQSCLQSWCHRGLQSQIWKWSSFSWWFIGRWESWGLEIKILVSSAMGLVGITKGVNIDRKEKSEDLPLGHSNLYKLGRWELSKGNTVSDVGSFPEAKWRKGFTKESRVSC